MSRKIILLMIIFALLTSTIALIPALAAGATAKAATTDQKKDSQLRPGGHGSYVVWLQKQLKKLGYYEGKYSSSYSSKTIGAVKQFQACNEISPQNGIGNKQTREKAFSKGAISRRTYDAAHNLTELRLGSKGSQVTQLQTKLSEYGYFEGDPSGKFDRDTYVAVRYFQAAHSLKATGKATRTTRQRLNDGKDITPFATYEQREREASAKRGSWGLRVAQIQKRLNELGYYNGKIDSSYTDAVKKAVIRFEQFNDFKTADGIVTTREREQLEASGVRTYDEVCGPDTIKPGASGSRVLKVQAILKRLKCYSGSLNGKYTSGLTSAVKKFQKSHGIYPTGVLYSPTLRLIHENDTLDDEVDARAETIIDVAHDQLGKKYRARTHGPSTFDCSGFSYYVFKKGANITLAQSSSAQSKKGKMVALQSEVMPGDLLFFATGGSKTRLNHVGVCISTEDDNIKFIHASSADKKVVTSSFKDKSNSNFYQKRFLFARRMW